MFWFELPARVGCRAPRCLPARWRKLLLRMVVDPLAGPACIAVVDVDGEPAPAGQFGVSSIAAMMIVTGGGVAM